MLEQEAQVPATRVVGLLKQLERTRLLVGRDMAHVEDGLVAVRSIGGVDAELLEELLARFLVGMKVEPARRELQLEMREEHSKVLLDLMMMM